MIDQGRVGVTDSAHNPSNTYGSVENTAANPSPDNLVGDAGSVADYGEKSDLKQPADTEHTDGQRIDETPRWSPMASAPNMMGVANNEDEAGSSIDGDEHYVSIAHRGMLEAKQDSAAVAARYSDDAENETIDGDGSSTILPITGGVCLEQNGPCSDNGHFVARPANETQSPPAPAPPHGEHLFGNLRRI